MRSRKNKNPNIPHYQCCDQFSNLSDLKDRNIIDNIYCNRTINIYTIIHTIVSDTYTTNLLYCFSKTVNILID